MIKLKVLLNPKTEYTIRLSKELNIKGIKNKIITSIGINTIIIIIIYRVIGYKIIHLNFLYVFSTYINQIIVIGILKLLGYKIIFTVHNISTHEDKNYNIERFYELITKCDYILIHYKKNYEEIKRQINIEKKSKIIYHPIW